jgi:putative ABC transport system permease protein
MIRFETGVLVLIAAVLGTAAAAAVLVAFSLGMTGSDRPAVSAATYAAVLASAAVLAWVASLLPARYTMRHPVPDVHEES